MTSVSEPALVDTNVLAYLPAMPDHAASRALLDKKKRAMGNRTPNRSL
ncbi:MAG TPA: hypothetical protein VGY77_05835 [Gemmataceae bacterium]|nr:hypothetical protein [Gemmataceae bacterium]